MRDTKVTGTWKVPQPLERAQATLHCCCQIGSNVSLGWQQLSYVGSLSVVYIIANWHISSYFTYKMRWCFLYVCFVQITMIGRFLQASNCMGRDHTICMTKLYEALRVMLFRNLLIID